MDARDGHDRLDEQSDSPGSLVSASGAEEPKLQRQHDIEPKLGHQNPASDAEKLQSPNAVEKHQSGTFDVVTDVVADRDLEIGSPSSEEDSRTGPDFPGWDGPADPQNPKNWSSGRKWAVTIIVSSFTFVTPVASAIVAPAFTLIGADFQITSDIELSLVLSIFILAYAVGPLFLGPLSEMYGRVIVLQLSNLVFLVFNVGSGLATSKQQMLAFRFLSGLGGSAPLVIGGGVLSDLFDSDERGKAVSIYSLAPLLGPALGPIAGGFMAESISWRWIFHVVSFTDALIQIAGLFLLRETYAPVLLERKKRSLVKGTVGRASPPYTRLESQRWTLWKKLQTSVSRPFILIGTQPIIQVLALYAAYLFGTMYLLLATFPKLWETRYGESVGIAGLNYISLGLGFFLGTQICGPLQDRIFRRLKARNGNVGKPEFRVPLMIPASIMVPIGLCWYGWAAQMHAHWIVPNLGTTIAAAGIYLSFLCIQTYIVDSYPRYAASAIGATTVLRSLAGFALPLIAPYMYEALDYGWGNTVLAVVAVVLGWPAPILLWRYGETLRQASTFASG